MTVTVRRGIAIAAAAVPLAALVVFGPLMRPRLGPTIASHWSGLGDPDGYTATWPSFGVVTGIVGALLIVTVVALVAAPRRGRLIALPAALVAGPIAAAWLASAWASADATTLPHAALGFRLLLVPASIGLAIAIVLVAPRAPAAVDPASTPNLALAPDERAVYSATTGSGVLWTVVGVVWALFAASLVVLVVTGAPGASTATVTLLLAAVTTSLLVPVRLTVDARGVRLASALLRVPLIRVPLDRIAAVTAEQIDPMQWGGWGLRFSGAGRAYVARRGPGLVVHRTNGSAVAITIDAPEVPAGLANALVARSRQTV